MITYAVRQTKTKTVKVIYHATKCQSHCRSWSWTWSTTIDIPWLGCQLQKHASTTILISVSIGRRSWCRCRVHVCTNFAEFHYIIFVFEFDCGLWPFLKLNFFRTHCTYAHTHMQLKIIENSIPFPVLFTRITRCTFRRYFPFIRFHIQRSSFRLNHSKVTMRNLALDALANDLLGTRKWTIQIQMANNRCASSSSNNTRASHQLEAHIQPKIDEQT